MSEKKETLEEFRMRLHCSHVSWDQLEEWYFELSNSYYQLRELLEEMTEDGCHYKDNCPSNANHYVCNSCKITRVLEKTKLE